MKNPISRIFSTKTCAFMVIGCLGAANVSATPFTESTDAGVTMPTATVLLAGTTSINGTIADGYDADLYKFTLASAGTITIDMLFYGKDANLLVFNGLGQFLAGDDDNNSSCTAISSLGGADSCLTLNLVAGAYFIGVGANNIGAFETVADYNNNNYFEDDDSGILVSPSSKALGLIGAEIGPNDFGSYTVNFSVASGANGGSVPEPGTFGLIALGMASFGAVKWKRSKVQ